MNLSSLAGLLQSNNEQGSNEQGSLPTPQDEMDAKLSTLAQQLAPLAQLLNSIQFSMGNDKFRVNVGGTGVSGGAGQAGGQSPMLAQLLDQLLAKKKQPQGLMRQEPSQGPSQGPSQEPSRAGSGGPSQYWRPNWSAPGGQKFI